MKLVAIHEVEYLNEKGKRAYAKPGHMFAVSDDKLGEKLKAIKSARDPNEAEVALEAMKAKAAAPAKSAAAAKPAGGANAGGANAGANATKPAGAAGGEGGAAGGDII